MSARHDPRACDHDLVADETDPERDVLGSLPRTRPARRSTKRDAPSRGGAKGSAKPAAAARRAPKAKAANAKPKAATTTPKAASSRSAPRSEAKPAPPPPHRKVPPAGYAAPKGGDRPGGHGTSPTEIVTTAVQAGVELTQIGITVSRQALKSVLDRVPKP